MVCRLEVEVRVSRMQGDQRDENQDWKERMLDQLRTACEVMGKMTADEGEKKDKRISKGREKMRRDKMKNHTYMFWKELN